MGFAVSDSFWDIAAVLMFLPGVVAAVATLVKLGQYAAAQRWAKTRGRVIVSKPASVRRTGVSGRPVVEMVPSVVFEYTVGARRLRGDRISIAENAGNIAVETAMERYAVGREVDVYFDPAQPSRAVLERDLPPGFLTGALWLLGFFVGGPLIVVFALTDLPRRVAHHIERPERAVLVVAASIAVGVSLGLWRAALAQFLAERKYIRATGRIVATGTPSHVTPFLDRARTLYRADIEYEYRVHGRRYRGNTLRSSDDLSHARQERAARIVARYPVGLEVPVWHAPDEPSKAVLERSPASVVVYSVILMGAVACLLLGLGVVGG